MSRDFNGVSWGAQTVTSDEATLHTAGLADQDGRRRARSLHVLVALEQKVAHPLAPLRRLAQVETNLLHGLEARESSLAHISLLPRDDSSELVHARAFVMQGRTLDDGSKKQKGAAGQGKE